MEQKIKIKCPNCGWIRSINILAYENSGAATVVNGTREEIEKVVESMKEMLSKSKLDDANAWLDMPACPICKRSYRYNVKTREVEP